MKIAQKKSARKVTMIKRKEEEEKKCFVDLHDLSYIMHASLFLHCLACRDLVL